MIASSFSSRGAVEEDPFVTEQAGLYAVEAFLPLLARMPLIDVRSPGEFTQGHVPGAVNLPLFDDAERAEVGTLYSRKGKQEAVLRGLALVGPKLVSLVRGARAAHEDFLRKRREFESGQEGQPPSVSCEHPEVALHCLRGGMRSQSVAWLLSTAGLRVYVLHGGYKSFRRFVLASFERAWPLVALGGKTGSGKTEALACLRRSGEQTLDLEHLARHRGSAFGGVEDEPQPTREHFENRVAMALYYMDAQRPVWVEDESENLGRVNVPSPLYGQLRAAPLAVMETPEEDRLARVLCEYGNLPPQTIADSLDRIRKKLGGLEHSRARAALDAGDLPSVARLLLTYYDRAYARQITPRQPFAVVAAATPEEAAARLRGVGVFSGEEGNT